MQNTLLQQHQESGREGALSRGDAKLVDAVHTLAANLNKVIEELRAKGDERASNAGLGRAAKVSSNTIGRARRGDGSITLLRLTKIAKALGYTPLQLLAPNLSMKDPPEVVSDPDEKDLLRKFRRQGNGERPTSTH